MQDLYSYNEYFPKGFWNSYYNFNSSIQIDILGSVEFPPVYSVSCFIHLSLGVSSWITSTQKDYVFQHHCCPGLRTVLFCFWRCFLRTACHPLLLLLIVFGLSVVSDSDPTECSPPGSSVHGDSPGKNTGVVAMPSSSGSSQPRDQTRIAGGFFTVCITREAPSYHEGN